MPALPAWPSGSFAPGLGFRFAGVAELVGAPAAASLAMPPGGHAGSAGVAVWFVRAGVRLSVRGCGGTGRRAGFRSRWGSRPLEVRFLSPASAQGTLDLGDHPVVGQLDAVLDRQLQRPVRDEQALRSRPGLSLESLLEGQ